MLERETLKWFKPAKGQFQTGRAKAPADKDRRAAPTFSLRFLIFRIDFRNGQAATFSSIEISCLAQRGVGRAQKAAAQPRSAAS